VKYAGEKVSADIDINNYLNSEYKKSSKNLMLVQSEELNRSDIIMIHATTIMAMKQTRKQSMSVMS
jgi:hypothetical protein